MTSDWGARSLTGQGNLTTAFRARAEPGFVGRSHEFVQLETALDAARNGQRRCVMISGEPGIGKTSLADRFSQQAAATGACVLWGRAWEDGGAPAFWPWTQIIRAFVHRLAPADRWARLGPRPQDLASLAPDALAAGQERPPITTNSGDTDDTRFKVFDAVAGFLQAAGSHEPLVLVFDDLHAADLPSLRLLQFVARDTRCTNLLLLATYSESDMRGDSPIATAIAQLARESQRISLRGLSRDEVGAMIHAITGHLPHNAQLDQVYEATEGNPLFVDEVTHLLNAKNRLDHRSEGEFRLPHVPEQIHETIRRRLSTMGNDGFQVLSLAAVLGREFNPAILQRAAADLPHEEWTPIHPVRIRTTLHEAKRSGILTDNSTRIGALRFTHGLVRDALHEALPLTTRVAAHQAAAHAIATLHSHDLEHYASEIAYHLEQALPGGDPQAAIAYLRQAGDTAVRHLAYESAADHYRRALSALSAFLTPDDHLRCELLLQLATALTRGCDTVAARQAFVDAAQLARAISATSVLARAVLGMADVGASLPGAGVDPDTVQLFEQAIEGLGPHDTAWRARLLARLALELAPAADPTRCRALADEATSIARRLHDPVTLARVLGDRHCAVWSPDSLDERLELAEEMLSLAQRCGDEELTLRARTWRILDALESADATTLDSEIAHCARSAAALKQPRHQWLAKHFEAVRAQSRGDFERAESLAQEAFELGTKANDPHAGAVYMTLLFGIRSMQGQLGEIEPAFTAHLADFAEQDATACGLAYVYTELDRLPEARAVFERLARNGFTHLPRNHTWLNAMACLAHVCTALEDADRAAMLYELLKPFHGSVVCIGHPATLCDAPVALYLGRLAAIRNDGSSAEAHFLDSRDIAERLGLQPALASTQYWHAALLLRSDGPPTKVGARQLLADAGASANRLGMAGLSRRIASLQQCLEAAPQAQPEGLLDPSRSASTPAVGATNDRVFRREGEFWTLAFNGQAVRMRDAKGLTYIATLLGHAGREFHVGELVAANRSSADASPRGAVASDSGLNVEASLGDAGEMFDKQARAAYKQRLADLEEDLAEARRNNDLGRIEQVSHEIDFLMSELRRATGLNGRDRRAASNVERARINVTRAISGAIQRIARHNPSLGTYLSNTIRTGVFCKYEPDPRSKQTWHTT